jgi:hypothetical protein
MGLGMLWFDCASWRATANWERCSTVSIVPAFGWPCRLRLHWVRHGRIGSFFGLRFLARLFFLNERGPEPRRAQGWRSGMRSRNGRYRKEQKYELLRAKESRSSWRRHQWCRCGSGHPTIVWRSPHHYSKRHGDWQSLPIRAGFHAAGAWCGRFVHASNSRAEAA